MNQSGLHWPNGRNLFRRQPAAAGRRALWGLLAVLVAAVAVWPAFG